MKKRALIISFTPIASAPRVLRQIRCLIRQGWSVTAAGFEDQTPLPSGVRFINLKPARARDPLWTRLKRYFRCLPFLFPKLSPGEFFFWIKHNHAHFWEKLNTAGPHELILCHDYFTLPIGFALSKLSQAPVFLDIHDDGLKSDAPLNNWFDTIKWLAKRHFYIHALHQKFFIKAHTITAASEGYARSTLSCYPALRHISVVRSFPFYEEHAFRKTSSPLRILYSGGLMPERGLETLIETAAFLKRDFRVIMRGSGDGCYTQHLQNLIDQKGLATKVYIENPVLFSQIVQEANKMDIGFFVQPSFNSQKTETLPNKFFEYIMAGLALVIGEELTAMKNLIKGKNIGILVPEDAPKIAAAINKLTVEEIDAMKKKSLEIAKEFCWEKEEQKFVNLLKKVAA